MATLLTIPGNFRTDLIDYEVFEFGNYNSDEAIFPGIVNPSRYLAVGGSGSPLTIGPSDGRQAVLFNGGEYLTAPLNDTWNSLRAAEHYLAVMGWFKCAPSISGKSFGGVWGASDAQRQYRFSWKYVDGVNDAMRIEMNNGSGTLQYAEYGPFVDPLSDYFWACFQMKNDQATPAVDCRLYVNGVSQNSAAGTGTFAVNVPSTEGFSLGYASGLAVSDVLVSQLIFWHGSTWLDDDSLDAIWNGGVGISVGGAVSRRRLMRRVLKLGRF